MRSSPALRSLIALPAVLAALAAPAAHAAGNGRLVVSQDVDADGLSQLATVTPKGTTRPLTRSGAGSYVGLLEATPDARSLFVYTNRSKSGLAVLRLRGRVLREVPNPLALDFDPVGRPLDVSVAPDGRSYLVATFAGDLVRGFFDARPPEVLLDAARGTSVRNVGQSPDGRRLALQVGGARTGLWLYDASTLRPVRRLAKRGADARWSPDGRRLVFATNYNRGAGDYEGGDLRVARADGSHQRLLRHRADRAATQPVWSPDGRRIAFVELASGSGDTHYRLRSSVWSVPSGGGRATRLVRLARPKVEEDAFHVPELAWLPAR